MGIYNKIDEIRRKPEHIRLRYVWVCVIISMALVLGIWALSLKSRQYEAQTAGQVAGQASIFDELQKQKDSLGQYQQEMGNIKGTLQQGLQSAQNQQSAQDQQNAPNQPSASSQEGFSGGGNPQNTNPVVDASSLLQ